MWDDFIICTKLLCGACVPSGYLAPEYASFGIVSEKVDVYSFGIVLLEIVSGRKNIDNKMLADQVYLYMWVRTYQQTNHF
jgi:serine/threonine protein kinase